MNAQIKSIRSLFGNKRIACDSGNKTAHDPKNGQFTSGSGGSSSPKPKASRAKLMHSYRDTSNELHSVLKDHGCESVPALKAKLDSLPADLIEGRKLSKEQKKVDDQLDFDEPSGTLKDELEDRSTDLHNKITTICKKYDCADISDLPSIRKDLTEGYKRAMSLRKGLDAMQKAIHESERDD